MAFNPDVGNDGGKDLIYQNHVHHLRRLRQVKPSIDNSMPRGYDTVKGRRHSRAAQSPLALAPTAVHVVENPLLGPNEKRESYHPFLNRPRSLSTPVPSAIAASPKARPASSRQALRSRGSWIPPVPATSYDDDQVFLQTLAANKDHKHDRIAKFAMNQEQLWAYEQFVRLLSQFERDDMMEIVCAAAKDGQDAKLMHQFPGLADETA